MVGPVSHWPGWAGWAWWWWGLAAPAGGWPPQWQQLLSIQCWRQDSLEYVCMGGAGICASPLTCAPTNEQRNKRTDRYRRADGGKADRDIQNKKENLLISSSTRIGSSGLSGATWNTFVQPWLSRNVHLTTYIAAEKRALPLVLHMLQHIVY